MFTRTALINVKVSFSNPEDITKLFQFLHAENMGGKWTTHNAKHFDGTFPPKDAEKVTEFLMELGIPEHRVGTDS